VNTQTNNIFHNTNLFDTGAFQNTLSTTADSKIEQKKLINDFDSDLILENIDKTTKNKAVRLNLKIKTLERNLANINEQLELILLLNLDKDKDKKEQLSRFKTYLEFQIEKLRNEKKKFGLIYSVNGFLDEKIDTEAFKMCFLKLINLFNVIFSKAAHFLKNNEILKSGFKW